MATDFFGSYLPWFAMVAGGLGVAAVEYRRGRRAALVSAQTIADDAATKALTAQSERIELLEKDRAECREKIAHLEGVVAQLRDENHTLRQLVMGETVPPALQKSMEQLAVTSADAIVTRIAALLKAE